MPTAILVDAGFFVKRYPQIFPERDKFNPVSVARDLHRLALAHLIQGKNNPRRELYRIFVYDCPPLTKKAHLPLSKKSINFEATPVAKFRLGLHEELRSKRKVALRLGHLSKGAEWKIHSGRLKDILGGKTRFEDLTDDDFYYEARQKGVDMRIGIDIASLAFKRQVNQIVLIAGDSDFVPAAKLARREGIDFILDPMRHTIEQSLNEHIDGLRTTVPGNGARKNGNEDHGL